MVIYKSGVFNGFSFKSKLQTFEVALNDFFNSCLVPATLFRGLELLPRRQLAPLTLWITFYFFCCKIVVSLFRLMRRGSFKFCGETEKAICSCLCVQGPKWPKCLRMQMGEPTFKGKKEEKIFLFERPKYLTQVCMFEVYREVKQTSLPPLAFFGLGLF